MKRSWLRTFADGLANAAGYVSKQINVTGSGSSWSLFSHPSGKTVDYLGAFKSWAYACVKARSADASRIKLHLYKVNRKTGDSEEVTDHEVLSLLRRVNPWMTLRMLIEYTVAYKLLAGEAFWYLVRSGKGNTGTIRQMWMLRPDWMTIKTDPALFVTGYVYRPPGGEAIEIPVTDIIHHKTFNPTDAYRGMSVIRAAATVLDKDQFSEEYQRKFYLNSAVPAVTLSTEQKLDDAIIARMREQWYSEFGGIEKAHRVAILEGGLKIEPFSVSQKDMELVAQMSFDRDKILAIFETPKSRLGMTEGVTVSNAEATDVIFAKTTRNDMEAIVDTLNEFLLPLYPDGEDMVFEFEDPVPENVVAKMERLKAAFSMGAITPNEIRQEIGFDAEEGLDNFYVPFSVTPINAVNDQTDEEEPVKAVKRKAHVVRAPAKTLKQKMVGDIADRVSKAVIGAVTKDLEKTEDDRNEEAMGKTQFTEEQQDQFWKAMIAKGVNFEALYERKIRENFKRQEEQTITRLNSTQKALTSRDADKILYRLSTENEITAELMIPVVRQILEEAGNDALDFVGVEERAFDMSSQSVKEFLRDNGIKGLKNANKVTKAKLRKVLAMSIKDALGIPETAKMIREVFAEAKGQRAEKIARTEVLKATNTATVEGYRQSNVVVGKQWYTAIDERVCQWCAPMHGRTKALDLPFFHQGETFIGKEGEALDLSFDEVGSPPLHPNCRCTVVPILRR